MQYFQYSYTDAEGVSRIQVNLDGFDAILSGSGAKQIEKMPMTDKQVRAFVRNANKGKLNA